MKKWIKNIRKIVRSASIYYKIFSLFLAIMVMILIVSTGFYFQGRKLLRNEISATISEQNENMTNALEDEIRKILVMQYELVEQEDIISLILAHQHETEEGKKEILQDIQQSLLTIWRGNRLMEEVRVVIPFCNLEISTGTNTSISDEDWKTIELYKDSMIRTPFYYNSKPMIVSGFQDSYYVIAEMNEEAMLAYINKRGNRSGDMGEYVLCDTQNKVMLGGKRDDKVESILQDVMEQEVRNQVYAARGYLVHVDSIERSSFECIRYVPEKEVYSDLNRFQMVFFLLIFVILFGGMAFLKKMFSMIHRPLHILMDGLEGVTKGNLYETIYYESTDEFSYIYESFNNMTEQLKHLIDKNYKQEILLHKSELRQLQTQISPHFLYNSFITLSNRIHEMDYEFAAEFSDQLGQYFMFVTRNGREFIPLKEELNHACVYAKIQHTRFRKRFRMQLDELDPKWEIVEVPRLIVQPVFENVFKYVVEKTRNEIFLHMGFAEGDGWLDIQIENSGDEISDDDLKRMQGQLETVEEEIHGMGNIHQRLQLIYKGRGGIFLSKGMQGGLKVTIRILHMIAEGEGQSVSIITGG